MERARSAIFILLAALACLTVPTAGLTQIGDYTSHQVTDTGLLVVASGDTLLFSLYAPDIVRVDFRPGGAGLADSTPVVIREPSAPSSRCSA